MKIAFCTQDLQRVDAHFGWAKNIAIYEVSPTSHQFVEAIQFDGDLQEDGNEDKLAPKIETVTVAITASPIGESLHPRSLSTRSMTETSRVAAHRPNSTRCAV